MTLNNIHTLKIKLKVETIFCSYTDFEVGSDASQPFHTLMWIRDSSTSYESHGDYYNITVSVLRWTSNYFKLF